jgi:hypothetical protein
MRAIFDSTRATMAQRVIDVIAEMGLAASPRTTLAIHGWVGFVEECVVRWIDDGGIDRDELLDMLTKSLPAVALSATDADVGTLASILTADQAIAAK